MRHVITTPKKPSECRAPLISCRVHNGGCRSTAHLVRGEKELAVPPYRLWHFGTLYAWPIRAGARRQRRARSATLATTGVFSGSVTCEPLFFAGPTQGAVHYTLGEQAK